MYKKDSSSTVGDLEVTEHLRRSWGTGNSIFGIHNCDLDLWCDLGAIELYMNIQYRNEFFMDGSMGMGEIHRANEGLDWQLRMIMDGRVGFLLGFRGNNGWRKYFMVALDLSPKYLWLGHGLGIRIICNSKPTAAALKLPYHRRRTRGNKTVRYACWSHRYRQLFAIVKCRIDLIVTLDYLIASRWKMFYGFSILVNARKKARIAEGKNGLSLEISIDTSKDHSWYS